VGRVREKGKEGAAGGAAGRRGAAADNDGVPGGGQYAQRPTRRPLAWLPPKRQRNLVGMKKAIVVAGRDQESTENILRCACSYATADLSLGYMILNR
jgi:hypothetical protein